MTNPRKFTAALVIVCRALAPGDGWVAAVRAADQSTYRSSGSQNPDDVRRVVAHLGVGQHVAVRVMSGTLRGHIQRIDADHFQLLRDRNAGSVDIAYGDVLRIGPNHSKTFKIIVVVAVGVLVFGFIGRLRY